MVPSPRAIYIGFIGFVALFVVLFAWFSGLPYWASALIVVAAILVNGLVARIEDDLPGGFNNPDGTDTPAYVHRVGAVTRWTGGIACWSTAAGVVFSMYYYDALDRLRRSRSPPQLFASAWLSLPDDSAPGGCGCRSA
jgi:hypothetical protein